MEKSQNVGTKSAFIDFFKIFFIAFSRNSTILPSSKDIEILAISPSPNRGNLNIL